MALKIKQSEKRLLSAFGIVIFLIANFAAYTYWQEKELKTANKKTALTKELKHLESLKAQVPLATSYQDALTQHLKRYDSLDTRDTYLTTFIQNLAEARLGLKLAKNAPLAGEQPKPDDMAKFIKSAYRGEVSGEWKKVFEFIYRLQEPTEFRCVTTMTLSSRKTEANDGESDLVCDFTIQKWWHPDSDILLAEQAEAAATAAATASVGASAPAAPATPTAPSAPAGESAAASPAKPKETEQNPVPTVGTPAPAANVQ